MVNAVLSSDDVCGLPGQWCSFVPDLVGLFTRTWCCTQSESSVADPQRGSKLTWNWYLHNNLYRVIPSSAQVPETQLLGCRSNCTDAVITHVSKGFIWGSWSIHQI